MENDAEQILKKVRDDITVFIDLKIRILRLTVVEKIARVLAFLSYGLVILLFAFFTVLFLFVALGFFLGNLLNNVALGFLVVGGLYLLLTMCSILARYKIRLVFINLIIRSFQMYDDEKENKI
ncbi:MAG: phage holin family protein [Odoribacter sp.]|nr:phage holin family protein [Odoribacter sp.]MDY3034357.1 phage holin family protein [Odoribacter sp.]